MTALLAPLASTHVVVEAAPEFIDEARQRVPETVQFHLGLFEEYEPADRCDLVVMSFILEHVLDPVALMKRAKSWLKPETGRLFAIVPNMRVLSRQLGRAIGVVGELAELTPADRAHGHRRSYDRISFDREIELSGATIVQRGGLMLKPFANMHMDKILQQGIIGEDQLRGLELLGHEYPDLCTAIYAVAA
jgi:2-polyprenyl-3-methyl-5-hydroxy-6-metoxy-1,4-benzoquinol methylase